jgi:hypothetical protein
LVADDKGVFLREAKNGNKFFTIICKAASYITTDPETGMCHMSHVLVNALFVEALRRKNVTP